MERAKIRTAVALAFVLLMAGCGQDPPAESVVVVVRHADRDGELLNEAGHQRAAALRDLVGKRYGRATAVIYTTFERTRQTVTPIIEADSPAEVEVEPHDYSRIAQEIRSRHDDGGGQVIVIAGHSDSVRPILEQLNPAAVSASAGDWFPCENKICGWDYDDVWTATLEGEAAAITKSNFGQPTPDPAPAPAATP